MKRSVFSLLLFLGMLTGCQTFSTPRIADLEDCDPVIRLRAIKWAGANRIQQAVPLLIDRLLEEDPSLRFYAITALQSITGQDHGYDYKAKPSERFEAVRRWRKAFPTTTGEPGMR
ncbi:MAG: HEAT repeat domain-containing protein [Sedimentisphaerales bacterium]|nr:HEAT repeat domain-containing protein [Sedimentisphaerales bacterium]